VKVAAGGGDEVGVQVWLPEALGDEMDDTLVSLQSSGDAQEGSRLGQGRVPCEDLGPEDEVHEAGLVLQGYGRRALPCDVRADD